MKEDDVPYYCGRIEKLRMSHFLKNTVFENTWINNPSCNIYKGFTPNEEKIAWNNYFENKTIENRNKLFNGYLWYACYVAMFRRIDNKTRLQKPDINHYIGTCSEILIDSIENFNSESFGASFYTYYISCVNTKEPNVTEEIFGNEITSRRTVYLKYIQFLKKLDYLNMSMYDAFKLNPNDFYVKFSISKRNIVTLMNIGERRIYLSDKPTSDDCDLEFVDLIADNKENSIDKSIDKMYTEEIEKYICHVIEKYHKQRRPNDFKYLANRDIDIFFSIMRDDFTLEEAGNKYGLTRERARQICDKYKTLLLNDFKFKKYVG